MEEMEVGLDCLLGSVGQTTLDGLKGEWECGTRALRVGLAEFDDDVVHEVADYFEGIGVLDVDGSGKLGHGLGNISSYFSPVSV